MVFVFGHSQCPDDHVVLVVVVALLHPPPVQTVLHLAENGLKFVKQFKTIISNLLLFKPSSTLLGHLNIPPPLLISPSRFPLNPSEPIWAHLNISPLILFVSESPLVFFVSKSALALFVSKSPLVLFVSKSALALFVAESARFPRFQLYGGCISLLQRVTKFYFCTNCFFVLLYFWGWQSFSFCTFCTFCCTQLDQQGLHKYVPEQMEKSFDTNWTLRTESRLYPCDQHRKVCSSCWDVALIRAIIGDQKFYCNAAKILYNP